MKFTILVITSVILGIGTSFAVSNRTDTLPTTYETHEVSCGFQTYLIPVPSNVSNLQEYTLGYCTSINSFMTE